MDIKKVLSVGSLIFLLYVHSSLLASEPEDSFDELAYLEAQTSAVTIDMSRYIGWYPDEKEWMKEASLRAVKDLDEIERRLLDMNLKKDLALLRDKNVEIIETLKAIYLGIESKDEDALDAEFKLVEKLYAQFSEKFSDAFKRYRSMPELPKDYDPFQEELKLARSGQDKSEYLKATRATKEGNYQEAHEILVKLQNRQTETAFQDCIMLRMLDCLLPQTRVDTEGNVLMYLGWEETLSILTGLIDKGKYSPVLYEVFDRWRTKEQGVSHGMSNTSNIPNKEYNDKRWGVIKVIKGHLKEHQDDTWARAQIVSLLNMSNIGRGGAFGNDNLVRYHMRYEDDSNDENKEGFESAP